MTTEQVRARTKTVTRRMGWDMLRAGDLLCAVEKSQGLGKGGKIVRLGVIRVVSVRQEYLADEITPEDVVAEGFQDWSTEKFVDFFCHGHRGVTPDSIVTRIEFEYID